jgi:hypothetical protein
MVHFLELAVVVITAEYIDPYDGKKNDNENKSDDPVVLRT